jgi:hypothetical protein
VKYYVTGIACNGERLRFERWAYEGYIRGTLRDEFLLQQLERCVRFILEY